MAKIYKAPVSIKAPDLCAMFPDGNYDWDIFRAAEDKYVAELAALARAERSNNGQYDRLIGMEMHFPVADGHARYMVWSIKPFTVIHLELGDAWRAHHLIEKGMNLQEALRQAAFREMFGKKEKVT